MHPTPSTSTASSSSHPPATPEVVETTAVVPRRHGRSGRRMINQYIIMERIGKGMHGIVQRGIDSRTGEVVAIKIVDRVPKHRRLGMASRMQAGRPHARTGPGLSNAAMRTTEDKIRREIAIMKRCHHEHVVQLKEVIDDPHSKRIFLVLEYMEGGELKWRTEASGGEGPLLSVDQIRKIFRQVILGLEYLHYQGIIHRDIKPANLLVKGDGTIKISDFGVSHYSWALRLASSGSGAIRTHTPSPRRPAPDSDTGAPTPVDNHPDDEVLLDDSNLAKTAGSPAFFAPELCAQPEHQSFGALGEPSSVPTSTTFGGVAEQLIGALPSSAPTSKSLVVPPERSPPIRTMSTSSSQTHRATSNPEAGSSRPRLSSSRHSSSQTPPISIPAPPSPSTPTLSAPNPAPPPITPAIDIWALGVTLYCLLFARVPFNAPNQFVLFKVIPTEDFDIPETMGSDAKKTGGRWGARNARSKGKSIQRPRAGYPNLADEQEGYEVVEILERLLEKDPLKRITLAQLKRLPWVTRGLPDPEAWLSETDPRREEMVVVKQEDVEGAVKEARLKAAVKKIKEKTRSAIGILSRIRSRSTSSVNVLGGDHSNDATPSASASSNIPSAGHVTPTPSSSKPPSRSADTSKKKNNRASYSAGQTLAAAKPGSTKGRSREGSPARSPLGRWGPFSSRQESLDTPRSRSPIRTASTDDGDDTVYDGHATETVRATKATRTPKPRRLSTNALLSPPAGGHVRRASSLSVSTRESADDRSALDAEELAAELRRNKSETGHHSTPQTPLEPPEKVTRKMSWFTRLGAKGKWKQQLAAAPMTAITAPQQEPSIPSNRPGPRRSLTTLEQSGSERTTDASLRYRQSHEVFTDDSSVGARSYISLSPTANRDLALHGASRLPPAQTPLRSPYGPSYHETTDDDAQYTADDQISFSFSDESDEEYDEMSPDNMIGAGGFAPIRNRGTGWEPMYPQRQSRSLPGSSGASSPETSPLGSAHQSAIGMTASSSAHSSPPRRTSNLSLELLTSMTSPNPSGPFHQSPSPLAYQSFSHRETDLNRGSFSEDIEENEAEDEDEDEDEDDFLEVRTRQHGSEGRARSSESYRSR